MEGFEEITEIGLGTIRLLVLYKAVCIILLIIQSTVYPSTDYRVTQMSLFGANRHQKNWPPLRRIGKIGLHSEELEIWLNSKDMLSNSTVAETRLIQQTNN